MLVALLCLVVGLFVVAVATEGRTGQGDARSGSSGPVRWLRGWTGAATGVSRADLAAPDCVPDPAGRLRVAARCVVTVAARGHVTRQLRLRADQPMTVTAPVSGQDYSAKSHLAAGADATIAVDPAGGRVTLECDAETCAATLLGVR